MTPEEFVSRYAQAWERWDREDFLDLFTEDVVYVVHPTEETVEGHDALRAYFRKEERAQGPVEVRMGDPIALGGRVAAEFWVTSTMEAAEPVTIVGCLLARLDPGDGRCSHFREYWFEMAGRATPFTGWGA
ncbi:MAG TPA: nuclear transport factor 2 family protein [Solirubrobacterales bacterium]|jgi:uncharacterized protein (TIGR02246 family)|nr:nuclear transport factor 2 family protein [Solirubrobacterales bacterium]